MDAGATRRARRAHVTATLAVVALLTVACEPTPPVGITAFSRVPAFPGTPTVAAYSGRQTKTVLLIGDSVMDDCAATITAKLAAAHLPATVVNASVRASGVSGTIGQPNRIDWVQALPGILDRYHPDLVVVHFVGLGEVEGEAWGSKLWYHGMEQRARQLVDIVQARNIPVYWILPAVSFFFFDISGTYLRFNGLARSYRDLAVERPGVQLVDWRSVLSPGEVWTQYMQFAFGTFAVRSDWTHFTDLGKSIAADETVAAIRPEWR